MGDMTVHRREWNDRAPVRLQVSRPVEASAAAVFAVLADHERWPEWFDVLSKVEVTGASTGVGARRRVHLKGLGAFDEEFYAWEEGREFGFSVVSASVPALKAANELVTISDRPDGNGVTVTYLQALELTWWSSPLIGLVRRRLLSGLRAGLDSLSVIAETGRGPAAPR